MCALREQGLGYIGLTLTKILASKDCWQAKNHLKALHRLLDGWNNGAYSNNPKNRH